MTKIAFISPHCLVDFTNGAAIATREGLKLLATQGFQCMAFCGTRLDEAGEGLIQEQLFRRKIDYEVRKVRLSVPGREHGAGSTTEVRSQKSEVRMEADGTGTVPATLAAGEGTYDARLIFLVDGNVPVTLFENGSTRGGWFGPQEVTAFLAACDIFLRKNRLDIVITYGGDPVSIAVQRVAKRHGAIVVFWLRNFSYHNRAPFEAVDCVIVPSEFSKRYYWEKLGLECNVLPSIVQWRGEAEGTKEVRGQKSEVRMEADRPHPGPLPEGEGGRRYVTFINPEAAKGVYVFARIARELAARRPDIPLFVVQGRSGGDALKNPALGLAEHIAGELHSQPGRPPHVPAPSAKAGTPTRNITAMPFTPNPGDFYPITKLLLMPSLWNESFGLVAVEAMLNGIPVLASNRGALPETIREGGFLFDIPARYTPETREVPTAEEVARWIETIIHLWDDTAEYDRASRAAHERAQAWHPDRLAPLYRDFFNRVMY